MSPDDLARILDDLGRRLGPSGEHVFALAVRQQLIVNSLWTAAFATVLISALILAFRQWRSLRSINLAIDSLRDGVGEHAEKVHDVQRQLREFAAAKEAAELDAMTKSERAKWYEAQAAFPSYFGGGYGYGAGGPSISDIRDANSSKWFVIGVALAVAAVALVGLLIGLPGLLNPEYAALRDILGAIGK